MKSKSNDQAMAEVLKADPEYAAQLLNAVLKDGDQAELMITMRQMAQACGGVQAVAAKANLNTTQTYRVLSEDGNPLLSTFSGLLKAMGLQINVQPLAQ